MATTGCDGPERAKSSAVARNCYSRWFSVTQDQIDRFAAATGDTQWIHQVDAERVGSFFRAPIAHGLLLVSLAISLARESGALEDATWVLYGFDNLRFRAPVRSGDRVRCLTKIDGTKELSGRSLVRARLVLEIENHRIPAFVAECLLLKLGHAFTSSPETSVLS